MKWGLSPCRAKICYNACNAPVFTPDADGIVTKYAYNDAGLVARRKRLDGSETLTTLVMSYDAAGRLVREGNKTYRYGYLDKVLSVTDGDATRTFTYHADGQLASANYGDSSESFAWDGLALIQRGDEQFMNEPHIGGGNPVASSKGTSYFNDALGTTVGSKSNGKYSAAALTAFGENLSVDSPTPTQNSNFFTGKPFVEGLGHAFLMRNYRAGLAKWQTADPMGYPDGWNQLAYCNNAATSAVDLWGCKANMLEVDPKRIKADKAELGAMMEEYQSQGWKIDEPRYIWSLLYYCNEEWKHTKHYEEPLSPLEQELTGCTKAIIDIYEDFADVYCPYRCTASLLKSKVLDLSEDAIITIAATAVGIWNPLGGAVISITAAGFRDAIRAIDGNTVTIVLGDGWTFKGRQRIDRRIDVELAE